MRGMKKTSYVGITHWRRCDSCRGVISNSFVVCGLLRNDLLCFCACDDVPMLRLELGTYIHSYIDRLGRNKIAYFHSCFAVAVGRRRQIVRGDEEEYHRPWATIVVKERRKEGMGRDSLGARCLVQSPTRRLPGFIIVKLLERSARCII